MSAQRPSVRAVREVENAGPRLDPNGVRLDARVVPLLSGAVHYFRLAPERWRPALESLRALGLAMVETYVPWSEHELSEGRYDFGEIDGRKNLGAFLDLAQDLGLHVFLRPGPNVNAELPCFGLPRRVVLDPRNQARSPRGNVLPVPAPPRMFPAPSYASRNFRAEVQRWFEAVAVIAAPRRWPKGPIVLLQVDNEVAFYFRDAPYDSDYHPHALADFGRFLSQRYGSIAELNACLGTAYTDFSEVGAPRKFEAHNARELVPYLDWMAFHEAALSEALATMATQLGAAGLSGLPLVHNLSMGDAGLPTPISMLERKLDIAGLDYYHGRRSLPLARRRTLRLAGSSRLPFAPELGLGAPPWFGARTNMDALHSTLAACAYGLRGFNLYMLVDRDRWYGAAIDPRGELRAEAEPWRKLIAAWREVGFHRLRRRAEVALSVPKEYAQLSRATHTLGALSPTLLDIAGLPASAACRFDRFGFEQPIQIEWEALLARLDAALQAAQIPFVYVESDVELTTLDGLRLVFAPSFEFADSERWQRLARFAARGGTVVHGPRSPTLNARMQATGFETLSGRDACEIMDPTATNRLVARVIEELGLARSKVTVTPDPLEVTVHEDDGRIRALFVINPRSRALDAELHMPHALRLRDALSDERFAAADTIALPIEGHSCRMLIVEGDAHAE